MKLEYIIIRWKHFSSNEEVITFVNNYFVEKNVEYYLGGLQRWEHRWEKCVELQEDYVEKQKDISEKMSCILVRSETFQTTLVKAPKHFNLLNLCLYNGLRLCKVLGCFNWFSPLICDWNGSQLDTTPRIFKTKRNLIQNPLVVKYSAATMFAQRKSYLYVVCGANISPTLPSTHLK